MAEKCDNLMAIFAAPYTGKCIGGDKLYSQTDFSKCYSGTGESKWSFNLKNAPPDEKGKDWIAGKVLKLQMGSKIFFCAKVDDGEHGTPGWMSIKRSESDVCSSTAVWIASYDNCQDCVANQNCIATGSGAPLVGSEGEEPCDWCKDTPHEPCPPTPIVEITPTPTPSPPPPAQMRCAFEWQAKWNCLTKKIASWRYVGKACNHQGFWNEWVCTEQPLQANNYHCTLKYYVLGPVFFATPQFPNCLACNHLGYWRQFADKTDPTHFRSLLGQVWQPGSNPVFRRLFPNALMAWVGYPPATTMQATGAGIYWPTSWPSSLTIRQQKGNVPCKCATKYLLTPCVDCSGQPARSRYNGTYPKVVQSVNSNFFKPGQTSSKGFWMLDSELCVTVTLAPPTAGPATALLTHLTYKSAESCNPNPQEIDCEQCVHGYALGAIRCDAVDKMPALVGKKNVDPGKVLDWTQITNADGDALIAAGLLKYWNWKLTPSQGCTGSSCVCDRVKWIKEKLPMVYMDENNFCWRLTYMPCPSSWVRHNSTPFNTNLHTKLTDGTYTVHSTPDDDCRKCVVQSTCPRFIKFDCRLPNPVNIPLSGGKCVNPSQASCRCGTGNNAIGNVRIGGPPGGVSWAYCVEAYGGDANDPVYFYWVYRLKGQGNADWKSVSGSYLMTKRTGLGKCMNHPQVTIGAVGSAGRAARSGTMRRIGRGPLMKHVYSKCMELHFLGEDDDYEFSVMAFTCPCSPVQWKAGTALDPSGSPYWPTPSRCSCPKLFPVHPWAAARGRSGLQSYCATVPTNPCKAKGLAPKKPKHGSWNSDDWWISFLYFNPAGGNCPGSGTFKTWTFDRNLWKATKDKNFIGKWFCGRGFYKDEAVNKGYLPSGGVWLKNAPHELGYGKNGVRPVSSRCCYKLTNVNRSGSAARPYTYKIRIYNTALWDTPHFWWSNAQIFSRCNPNGKDWGVLEAAALGRSRADGKNYDSKACGARKRPSRPEMAALRLGTEPPQNCS